MSNTPVGDWIAVPTPVTREKYLAAMRTLSTVVGWRSASVGVLSCTISGSGSNWYGSPEAPKKKIGNHYFGLQHHQVSSAEEARRKSIATMRAWVVRNITN